MDKVTSTLMHFHATSSWIQFYLDNNYNLHSATKIKHLNANKISLATSTMTRHKVTVSIPAIDLFPHPRITPFCIFSLTYSCTCLELFPKGQSIQVHDLAKNEWILFTVWKWMQSTHGNSGLR
jgi:hypothetical protein